MPLLPALKVTFWKPRKVCWNWWLGYQLAGLLALCQPPKSFGRAASLDRVTERRGQLGKAQSLGDMLLVVMAAGRRLVASFSTWIRIAAELERL